MRRVKFPLERNGAIIEYPDDRSYFSNVLIDSDNDLVYADYTGSNGTIEDSDEIFHIALTISVDKNVAAVGEAVSYTGTFTPAFDIPIVPLSLLNRDGLHVKNAGISVVNGQASGTFTFDRSGDYIINSVGINHWKDIFKINIDLAEDVVIRVYE